MLTRPVWLCEELGLEYKLVTHLRDPVLAPNSLKQVPGNATGKAPFLEDPEAGVTLSESAAIGDYILTKYGDGKLRPAPNDEHYADYLHWYHYANGTSQPAMTVSMFLSNSGAPADSWSKKFADSRLAANFQLLNERLKDNQWLAGPEFTAADIMNVYPLTTQRYFGPQVSLAAYPNILRWLKDCSGRPGFRKYVEKGDPDMKLLIGAEAPAVSLGQAGGMKSDMWRKQGAAQSSL